MICIIIIIIILSNILLLNYKSYGCLIECYELVNLGTDRAKLFNPLGLYIN